MVTQPLPLTLFSKADDPFIEEMVPNIQYEPHLVNLEALSSFFYHFLLGRIDRPQPGCNLPSGNFKEWLRSLKTHASLSLDFCNHYSREHSECIPFHSSEQSWSLIHHNSVYRRQLWRTIGQWRNVVSVLGAKQNPRTPGLLLPALLRREKTNLLYLSIPGALMCWDSSRHHQYQPWQGRRNPSRNFFQFLFKTRQIRCLTRLIRSCLEWSG